MSSSNEVKWYLVDDDNEEIIEASDDILDIIRLRQETETETRITDKEEEEYDKRNQSSKSGNWGQVSSFG